VQHITWAVTDSGPLVISATGPREIALLFLKQKKNNMTGAMKTTEILKSLTLPGDVTISDLLVDDRGEDLYAVVNDGQLLRVDLRDLDNPKPAAPRGGLLQVGTAVTAIGFLTASGP